MRKVFHPQVASVLQSAFREFRHVSGMTVEKMCEEGVALSKSYFYRV